MGLVAAQALVRDLFPVSQIAQVFSLLILVIAVSPMIAPTVGGYATMAFGWHSIFLILAVITALMLVGIYFVLPDGRQPDAYPIIASEGGIEKFLHRHQTTPVFDLYAGWWYCHVGPVRVSGGFVRCVHEYLPRQRAGIRLDFRTSWPFH